MLLGGSRGRFGCSVRDHNSSNRSSAHPLSQLQCNACFLRVKIYGTTLFKVSLWRDEMQMLTSRFPVFSVFFFLQHWAKRNDRAWYLIYCLPLSLIPHSKKGWPNLVQLRCGGGTKVGWTVTTFAFILTLPKPSPESGEPKWSEQVSAAPHHRSYRKVKTRHNFERSKCGNEREFLVVGEVT